MQIEQQIVKDYLEFVSVEDIKKNYKIGYNRMKAILIANNVWDLSRSVYMAKQANIHLRKVKENPFTDLNNPIVQYWLGVLAADGSIYKTKISLSSKYLYFLEKFKLFCKSDNVIMKMYSKQFDCYYYSISFGNYEIADYLKSLGIVENKTETLKINFKFGWNFLQGFIDGDGSVVYHKRKKGINNFSCCISMVTKSDIFAEQLVSFLRENDIHCRHYKYKLNLIHITNFINCRNLLQFIYKDRYICLEHKYEKAQLIRNYKLKTP